LSNVGNPDHATRIDAFTVEPERAPPGRSVGDGHREPRAPIDGFSANIRVSTDGTPVVNYARWHSAESFQAILGTPTDEAAEQQLNR
jgi:hypothetical protein